MKTKPGGDTLVKEDSSFRTDAVQIMMIGMQQNDEHFIKNELRDTGYAVKSYTVNDRASFNEALNNYIIDIILCQIDYHDFDGVCLAAGKHADIPVIAVAVDIDTASVVKALSLGFRDTISVNMVSNHLLLILKRELKYSRLEKSMRKFKKAYLESEQRCRTLLDSSHDAVAYILDGIHVYANRNYLDMFRYASLEDIESLPVLDIVVESEVDRFRGILSNFDKSDAEKSIEIKCLRDDFTEFDCRMEFSQASIEGQSCTQIILSDTAVSQVMFNELEVIKSQDSITGLYNRHAFLEELKLIISDVSVGCTAGAVYYISIDEYDHVIQSLGHESMDAIVCTIARQIDGQLNDNEISARFGDHVFTVISADKEIDDITSKAEELLYALDTIVEHGDSSMRVNCSIGICGIRSEYSTPYEIIAFADMACRQAVQQGGNRYLMHEDEAPGRSEKVQPLDVHKWVVGLEAALEENRFYLMYQPVVSLRNDDMIYDVAVRMKDDQGNEILPSEFLPAAESTGMIGKIDQWIIGKALRAFVQKNDECDDIVFIIKLSDSAIVDKQLLPWVYERIKTLKIDARRLIFQINESAALTHVKQINHFCSTLKKMRIKIAISDFGQNSAPFNLLKTIFVDYLIFSTSLTSKIMDEPEIANSVLEMVQYAHSIEKKVFARSVEDAEHMKQVFECGFDYIQGNFLKEPDVVMGFNFDDNDASNHRASQYRA